MSFALQAKRDCESIRTRLGQIGVHPMLETNQAGQFIHAVLRIDGKEFGMAISYGEPYVCMMLGESGSDARLYASIESLVADLGDMLQYVCGRGCTFSDADDAPLKSTRAVSWKEGVSNNHTLYLGTVSPRLRLLVLAGSPCVCMAYDLDGAVVQTSAGEGTPIHPWETLAVQRCSNLDVDELIRCATGRPPLSGAMRELKDAMLELGYTEGKWLDDGDGFGILIGFEKQGVRVDVCRDGDTIEYVLDGKYCKLDLGYGCDFKTVAYAVDEQVKAFLLKVGTQTGAIRRPRTSSDKFQALMNAEGFFGGRWGLAGRLAYVQGAVKNCVSVDVRVDLSDWSYTVTVNQVSYWGCLNFDNGSSGDRLSDCVAKITSLADRAIEDLVKKVRGSSGDHLQALLRRVDALLG